MVTSKIDLHTVQRFDSLWKYVQSLASAVVVVWQLFSLNIILNSISKILRFCARADGKNKHSASAGPSSLWPCWTSPLMVGRGLEALSASPAHHLVGRHWCVSKPATLSRHKLQTAPSNRTDYCIGVCASTSVCEHVVWIWVHTCVHVCIRK